MYTTKVQLNRLIVSSNFRMMSYNPSGITGLIKVKKLI